MNDFLLNLKFFPAHCVSAQLLSAFLLHFRLYFEAQLAFNCLLDMFLMKSVYFRQNQDKDMQKSVSPLCE